MVLYFVYIKQLLEINQSSCGIQQNSRIANYLQFCCECSLHIKQRTRVSFRTSSMNQAIQHTISSKFRFFLFHSVYVFFLRLCFLFRCRIYTGCPRIDEGAVRGNQFIFNWFAFPVLSSIFKFSESLNLFI